MKKLLFLLLLISASVSAQIEKVDTVINGKCYTSYYSYKIKAPAYVVYKLSTGKILYSTVFTNKKADNSQTKFDYLFDFSKLRKQR